MAQLIVRDLEASVKKRLQQRARQHGQSMEQEARDILRDAVAKEQVSFGLGTEIAQLFARCGLEVDIEELHGHELQIPRFKE